MKNPLPTRPNLFKIIQDNYDNKRKQIRSGGNPSSLKSKVNMSLPPMETRSGSINPYLYSIHPQSDVQGFGFGVQGSQDIGRFNLSGGVESNYMPNQGMANPMFNAGVGYRFYNGGYISDRAKATQFGQYKRGGGYFPPYHSYTPPRMEDGGLLSRTVTCSNCGHSWKGATGGLDPMTCHKCGGTIKMRQGGSTFYNQEGFGTTVQTTVDPSVEKARDCGKDCNNKAKGIIDYSTSAERKQDKAWDKEQAKADRILQEEKRKASENFINMRYNYLGDQLEKPDYKTRQQEYNQFLQSNPTFGKDPAYTGQLTPEQRYALLNNTLQYVQRAPQISYATRLSKKFNISDTKKLTMADMINYANQMGGYDKFREWYDAGGPEIQRYGGPTWIDSYKRGGDISIPNLNTDDMNIMDYMRNGGIYAYADGGDTKASIVDYLNAQGMASDKTSRKKLAESMGIKGYTGSYDQNVEMVTRLNNSRYNPSQQAAQNPYVIARPETAPAQSGFGSMPRMSQPAPRQAAPAPRTSKKPAAKQAPVQQQVVGQDSGFRPYSPEQLNQMYNFPGTLNFKKPATTAKQAATRKTKQANAEDQRNLESGMVTDKGTNMTHIIKNGKIVKSFSVLTGQARDVNYSPYTVAQLAKNPSLRGTPVGTYFSKPDSNLYGEKGFRMNPIPAFGQAAPAAQPGLAQHITFGKTEDPAEYRRREALYNQSPAARATSYGCTNCRKPDLDYMVNAFPQGDTTMVIDSRRAADANLLNNKFKKKAHGGENDDYSGTYSAGVYYGQGGSFIPEFYSPEYGLPEMMYGTEYDNNYSYADGGLVKGGEYDMSEQEIQNLIDQGYKIQYI